MDNHSVWNLNFINQVRNGAFIGIGDELVVINPDKEFVKYAKDRKKIHLMITSLTQNAVDGLVRFIRKVKEQGVFQKNGISVYFPNEEVIRMLADLGVSEDDYTYYINLWDEIYVDGFKSKVEYIFESNQAENESYSLELSVENEIAIFFSGAATQVKNRITRTRVYDAVYQFVGSDDNPTAPGYEMVRDAFSKWTKGEKNKVWLVLQNDIDMPIAQKDGFNIVSLQ